MKTMILILSSQDVDGKKPRDHLELMKMCPRFVPSSCDAELVYVEGCGFVKDRFGDGAEQLRNVLASLPNAGDQPTSEIGEIK